MTLDDEEGTRIAAAKSKLLAADETYRQWWEQQQM